ncbi:MAG: hypothetical protein P4L84_23630 [Isosphaeraceae bacterium]|nr:hypothetical protein [Isosphaeraceae bacterium]
MRSTRYDGLTAEGASTTADLEIPAHTAARERGWPMRPDIKRPTIAPLRSAPHRQYFPDIPALVPRHGLYQGEPETCRRDLRSFLPILSHLGLMLAVFKVYHIEGRAFQMLVALALVALPLHYLLPLRWKKPCFSAVSIVGLFLVFGPAAAACILALGSVYIGLCYAPVAWRYRAALVAGLTVALALLRPRAGDWSVPATVWPIVASMFMFRMIVLLYELKHAKAREPLADVVSYFFVLPNLCFTIFPVVDYRTMQRGFFAQDVHAIQRRGLRMMFWGTVHLLLYREIRHEFLIPAEDVHDFASLSSYLVCNYLRYLHVSGQFHIACGMLHLFGFQLPETHHFYLLATGFTDYWRRINIYWKDFMVRVVFNPVVFRLKRWPQPAALAVATVAVFVTTWALHAYQSFWLKEDWRLSVPDALFWAILGALVLVNVQFDARRRRVKATSGGAEWSARLGLVRVAKTAGTFVTIVLLWSLWDSPSVGDWLDLLRRGLGV